MVQVCLFPVLTLICTACAGNILALPAAQQGEVAAAGGWASAVPPHLHRHLHEGARQEASPGGLQTLPSFISLFQGRLDDRMLSCPMQAGNMSSRWTSQVFLHGTGITPDDARANRNAYSFWGYWMCFAGAKFLVLFSEDWISCCLVPGLWSCTWCWASLGNSGVSSKMEFGVLFHVLKLGEQ